MRRALITFVALACMATTTAACSDTPRSAGSGASPASPLSAAGYTADQLRQALLLELPGYRQLGEPDFGAYGSLTAVRDLDQLQRQVTLNKPRCASVGRSVTAALQTAPAALITFTRGDGQAVTETLLRVSVDTADRQLRWRVPPGCRSFRARAGGQVSQHEVVEASQNQLDPDSRTVGVLTTSTSSVTTQVAMWYVMLKASGYLVTITLYGPAATQTEAEQIAHQAHRYAERILP